MFLPALSKKVLLLLALALFSELSGQSGTIHLKGVIHHPSPENKEVDLHIARPGSSKMEQLYAPLPPDGEFSFSFELPYAQDIYLSCGLGFSLLAHPGDSIFVEWDGSTSDYTEMLQSVRFSGKTAVQNNRLISFTAGLEAVLPDRAFRFQQSRELFPAAFRQFRDSLYRIERQFADRFLADGPPDSELTEWIRLELLFNYAQELNNYLGMFPLYQGMKREDLEVPADFFSFLQDIPPLQPAFLINTEVSYFWPANFFGYQINTEVLNNLEEPINSRAALKDRSAELDSRCFRLLLEKTEGDPLLRELTLASWLALDFQQLDTTFYTRYGEEIFANINTPFIAEAIHAGIKATRAAYQPAEVTARYLLPQTNDMDWWLDSIRSANEGQVVFIDLWATWCGSCLSAMPDSKILQEKLAGQPITYLFLCMYSDQERWQPLASTFGLSGTHYFLNEEQCQQWLNVLGLKGVGLPHYVVIDKTGNIRDQGNHLHPAAKHTLVLLRELMGE